VKDFFRTKEIDDFHTARAGADFDPRLSLCRIYLYLSKHFLALPLVSKSVSQKMEFEEIIYGFTYQMVEVENRDSRAYVSLCDEVGRISASYCGNTTYQYSSPEPPKLTVDARGKIPLFFEAVVKSNLVFYMGHVLSTSGFLDKRVLQLLLGIALDCSYDTPQHLNLSTIQREMVFLLLERGADPNETINDQNTIWEDFLLACRSDPIRSETEALFNLWCDLFEGVIQYGADITMKFVFLGANDGESNDLERGLNIQEFLSLHLSSKQHLDRIRNAIARVEINGTYVAEHRRNVFVYRGEYD
jgi:hypothetical protein